jgi:hypothetical protein
MGQRNAIAGTKGLKITLNNVWILYNTTHPNELTIQEFMEKCSEELIMYQ